MRALLPLLLLVSLAASAVSFGAEHSSGSSKHVPDIKLKALVDVRAPEQQPILIVHMLNQSGHELRVPDPPLLCKSAPGALSIKTTKFSPAGGGKARRPAPCGLEVDRSNLADIRERAREWIAIEPGEDYIVRRPLSMGLDALAAGIYKFRVVYSGPAAGADDLAKLTEAGISAPEGQFQSPVITYRVKIHKP